MFRKYWPALTGLLGTFLLAGTYLTSISFNYESLKLFAQNPLLLEEKPSETPIVTDTETPTPKVTITPTNTKLPTDTTAPIATLLPTPTPTAITPVLVPIAGLTIYGSYGSNLQDIWSPSLNFEDVSFGILLDEDEKESFNLFLPSINTAGERIIFTVIADDACAQELTGKGNFDPNDPLAINPNAWTTTNCYSVQTSGQEIPPGEYNSKLIYQLGLSGRQQIAITVKIAQNIWWLVLMVAFGVVSTEILGVWNQEIRYRLGWWALRIRWLNLLTDDLNWITIEAFNNNKAKASLLKTARNKMGVELQMIKTFIAKLKSGDTPLDNVLTQGENFELLIDPLMDKVGIYYGEKPTEFEALNTELNNIYRNLNTKLSKEFKKWDNVFGPVSECLNALIVVKKNYSNIKMVSNQMTWTSDETTIDYQTYTDSQSLEEAIRFYQSLRIQQDKLKTYVENLRKTLGFLRKPLI